MEYEWDEAKRLSNFAKHGVDFLEALLIFEGYCMTAEDDRRDYGETRWISIGMADGQCFVVVHTRRAGIVRVISARKGGQRDRDLYQASLPRGAAPQKE